MTPELKAKELVEMFLPYCTYDKDGLVLPVAKACAIICCDEILGLPVVWYDEKIAPEDEATTEFWEKVKTKIKTLKPYNPNG